MKFASYFIFLFDPIKRYRATSFVYVFVLIHVHGQTGNVQCHYLGKHNMHRPKYIKHVRNHPECL